MAYATITTGVFTSIPKSGLYELPIKENTKIYLSATASRPTLYDAALNLIGGTSSKLIEFTAGSYLVNAAFSGSYYALSVYIPSYESYSNLRPLSSGTYVATSWDNFYKLMLKENAPVWIAATGDNASAAIYDENLNFVAHVESKPLNLPSGNYIVIASYNGYKNGRLDISVEQSKLGSMESYPQLYAHPPLDNSNDFIGSAHLKVDTVHGLAGNDRFFGGGDGWLGGYVADMFFGGDGIDTALYQGQMSEYTIINATFYSDSELKLGDAYEGLKVVDAVSSRDGTDLLNEVERLHFSDKAIAFDIEGNAGQAYRIYKAAFDRAPDEAGLGYWIKNLDNGQSLNHVAQGFIDSAEFSRLYGASPSDAAFIDLLYQNILDRSPDPMGHTYWVDHLYGTNKSGLNPEGILLSRADVLVGFSESAENKIKLTGLVENGIEYLPYQMV